ncbi:hypothetical protein ACLESD_21930 [Pyxidicoccus sp. 3LFB2]
MKMNPFVITSLLALGLGTTACTESTPSLQLLSASPVGEDCTLGSQEDAQLVSGSLNVAFRPQRGSGYPLVLSLTTNVQTVPIDVEEQPITNDADLNTVYLTGVELSYKASGDVELSEPEGDADSFFVPIHGTVSGNYRLQTNLLTNQIEQEVRDLVAAPGTAVDLLVTVRIIGKRVSGEEQESNEIVFPLTVFNQSVAALQAAVCGPERRFEAPTEPCDQRGLNGVLPACEDVE